MHITFISISSTSYHIYIYHSYICLLPMLLLKDLMLDLHGRQLLRQVGDLLLLPRRLLRQLRRLVRGAEISCAAGIPHRSFE